MEVQLPSTQSVEARLSRPLGRGPRKTTPPVAARGQDGSAVPLAAPEGLAAGATTVAAALAIRSKVRRRAHGAKSGRHFVAAAATPGTVSAPTALQGPHRAEEDGEAKVTASLGEKWQMHEELMDKGFARLSEVQASGLLDQCIRISERVLGKVMESADWKYRQLDMEKPKVAGILATPGILEIFHGAGWMEEGDWLVLPEGTPFELAQRAVDGLQREQRRRATVQSTAENPNERRFNPWDGKVYTFKELEKCLERADLTLAEIQEHWAHRCRPIAQKEGAAIGGPEVPVASEPQVEAWQQMWKIQSINRMWTSADVAHVHAISGAIYFALGAGVLLYTCATDIMTINGNSWALTSELDVTWMSGCQSFSELCWSLQRGLMSSSAPTLPMEVKLLALFAGVLNALSGLQPSLLGSRSDVLKILGFGSRGDVKTGGFLNAAAFYLVLAYQTARAVWPELAIADPLVGGLTLLLVAHQAFILNCWVQSGHMHRVDAFLVPGIFNLPVTLHLLAGSQAWWEELCNRFDAWPEFFFSGNFAVAWACAMVTLVLSLYERRVISLELRGLLMLSFPAVVFLTVFLRALALLPQGLDENLWLLLTLNP
ncbi:unnamed protein product [Symbiodinium sp. CCMP2592]|nr:unnamed protein product [Symbiodinium sp. CCMP2592]